MAVVICTFSITKWLLFACLDYCVVSSARIVLLLHMQCSLGALERFRSEVLSG